MGISTYTTLQLTHCMREEEAPHEVAERVLISHCCLNLFSVGHPCCVKRIYIHLPFPSRVLCASRSSQHLEHSDLLNVDMVQGDNAEGFLDGRPRDYETSSLLSADCKFGRFARAHTVDVDTARAIEISSGSVVTPYSIVSPNRVRANL